MFGYRYDTETGLYYLQSRYYNPEWGRFINADALGGQVGELLSHNIFAYCSNNPIVFNDQSGYNREIMCDGGGGGALIYAAVSGGLADCLRGLLYGFVGTIESIATGALVRNYINSISSSQTKAKTKTKTVASTNTNSQNSKYLRAKVTHPGADVYVDQPLNLQSARMILEIGGDVYANNAADAQALCIAVGGGFTGPTNDGNPLSAMHYHPLSYAARGHVFFGKDPNLKFVTIFK